MGMANIRWGSDKRKRHLSEQVAFENSIQRVLALV
jgi:hypothetical protein